jgi:FlaA1/EpsC-like NDP-sugar epimerase
MDMDSIKNYKRILITGGTGSFGRRFVHKLLTEFEHIEQLIIFSRDEYKQYRMRQNFPAETYPQLKFVLGDVRDREKLNQSLQGIELVIHAAALKQVDTSETNPMEFVKTNVLGSENVIQAAIYNQVKKVIALSSDKAVNPISLYGGTKLCADKLFLAATQAQNIPHTIFSVVRYGNVFGARGSVVPFFLEKAKKGEALPLTHSEMTRFSIPYGLESDLILFAIEMGQGGEIFVPQAPSYRVEVLAEAICPHCATSPVGLRPGEKVFEELISTSEADYTYQFGNFFVIYPPSQKPPKDAGFQKVPADFQYISKINSTWLDIHAIQEEVKLFIENEKLFSNDFEPKPVPFGF